MLKKNLIVVAALVLTTSVSFAQDKFYTKTGKISFLSKAPIEEIEAKNKTVTAVLDSKTGALQFAVQMKGFEFEKQLMQQHFNENYVESDKYPKATFSGSFSGDVPLDKEGVYKVTVKGNLTLHNVTRPLETPATIEVKGGRLLGKAEFKLKPEDFNITMPSLVRDKIAQEMRVDVRIDCGTNK